MNIEELFWSYHAEGNANIILKNVQHRKILRFRKEELAIGKELDVINSKLLNTFSIKNVTQFVTEVLQPLFGPSSALYIPVVETVPISTNFLRRFSKEIYKDRPHDRKHRNIDLDVHCAQLMPHVGLLPMRDACEEFPFNVSVELKPKWGFLPYSSNISANHCVKKTVCRFCMHQVTKLKLGKIKVKSYYCPMNLYSNCTCRIHNAITSLFKTPQNNLSISLNGERVQTNYFDSNVVENKVAHLYSTDKIANILTKIIYADSFHSNYDKSMDYGRDFPRDETPICGGNSTKIVHAENCKQMGYGGVFKMLKSFQALDNLDVEMIHKIYRDELDCGNLKNFNEFMNFDSKLWHNTVKHILENELDVQKHEELCRFLISNTLKDCSVIITFQCTNNTDLVTSLQSIYDEEYKCSYKYQIKLVDLDPFYLHNIPYSYFIDQEIISNFITNLKEQDVG